MDLTGPPIILTNNDEDDEVFLNKHQNYSNHVIPYGAEKWQDRLNYIISRNIGFNIDTRLVKFFIKDANKALQFKLIFC